MLFTESSVCMPKFKACSSILFSGKSAIYYFFCFAFLKYKKGCGHIDMLITFSGDTDLKHVYIWVCGLTSIVLA